MRKLMAKLIKAMTGSGTTRLPTIRAGSPECDEPFNWTVLTGSTSRLPNLIGFLVAFVGNYRQEWFESSTESSGNVTVHNAIHAFGAFLF